MVAKRIDRSSGDETENQVSRVNGVVVLQGFDLIANDDILQFYLNSFNKESNSNLFLKFHHDLLNLWQF